MSVGVRLWGFVSEPLTQTLHWVLTSAFLTTLDLAFSCLGTVTPLPSSAARLLSTCLTSTSWSLLLTSRLTWLLQRFLTNRLAKRVGNRVASERPTSYGRQTKVCEKRAALLCVCDELNGSNQVMGYLPLSPRSSDEGGSPHRDAELSRPGNVLLCRRPNDRPTTLPSPPARERSSGMTEKVHLVQQLGRPPGSEPTNRSRLVDQMA